MLADSADAEARPHNIENGTYTVQDRAAVLAAAVLDPPPEEEKPS
jgi:16S rRNA C967 or C1407 C5-methylase (RsmB/RsmF family)